MKISNKKQVFIQKRIIEMFIWIMAGVAIIGLPARSQTQQDAAWREDFSKMPTENWEIKTKPGTDAADFKVVPSGDGTESYLEMKAVDASSTFASELESLDLKKTPIMKWRWRVLKLPKDADGNDPDKDDQAIGIYLSTGGMFRQKSLAYRWETKTPKGSEGKTKYAAGVVSVYWIAVRNEEDAVNGKFFEETRNVAEDFQKAFGEIPDDINLGISCNSNYTKTEAQAQLDYIEFVAAP